MNLRPKTIQLVIADGIYARCRRDGQDPIHRLAATPGSPSGTFTFTCTGRQGVLK